MVKKNCFICGHQCSRNFDCELGLDDVDDFSRSESQICCTPDFDKVLHLDADLNKAHKIGLSAGLPDKETTAYKEFMRTYLNRADV